MMKEGLDVKGIVLVDAPCPTDHVPLSPSTLDHIITQGKPSRSETEMAGSVKEQFRKSSELLKRYSPSSEGPRPRVAFLRSREGMKMESESMREEIPVWLADRDEPKTTVNGWETLLEGKLERWDIPGDHFQPFLPGNVSVSVPSAFLFTDIGLWTSCRLRKPQGVLLKLVDTWTRTGRDPSTCDSKGDVT